jgi:hypothetical protein
MALWLPAPFGYDFIRSISETVAQSCHWMTDPS